MLYKVIITLRLDTGEEVSISGKAQDKLPDREMLQAGLDKWAKTYDKREILYLTTRSWRGKVKTNAKFSSIEEVKEWVEGDMR